MKAHVQLRRGGTVQWLGGQTWSLGLCPALPPGQVASLPCIQASFSVSVLMTAAASQQVGRMNSDVVLSQIYAWTLEVLVGAAGTHDSCLD